MGDFAMFRVLIVALVLLVATAAMAQCPDKTCQPPSKSAPNCCPPAPPGTWQPIQYPTPLRNLLFGTHRWTPDPGYRWQPGHWVPTEQTIQSWQWQPGKWIPNTPAEMPQ
jgi:hypothetical protein